MLIVHGLIIKKTFAVSSSFDKWKIWSLKVMKKSFIFHLNHVVVISGERVNLKG